MLDLFRWFDQTGDGLSRTICNRLGDVGALAGVAPVGLAHQAFDGPLHPVARCSLNRNGMVACSARTMLARLPLQLRRQPVQGLDLVVRDLDGGAHDVPSGL